MSQMIFVNLPVSDLAAARRFLEALGATNEPKFTDETAAAMKFSDSIFFMLLTHDKYRQFTPLPIADAKTSSGVLLCLSRDSREAVDNSVDAAVAAGGKADPSPKQDYGVMYDSFLPQMNLGMGGVPKRSAFIIDKNGVIQYAESNDDARQLPNFEKIKAKLGELK